MEEEEKIPFSNYQIVICSPFIIERIMLFEKEP